MDAKNEKAGDTPRTDAATEKDAHVLTQFAYHDFVDGDFARGLERENAELARDKAILDFLCDKSRVYFIHVSAQPSGDTIFYDAPTKFRETMLEAMQPQPARKD